MFFHGSPTRHAPGTVLAPGRDLNRKHNGAANDHVYMTTDLGWTMSQIHADDRLGCIDPHEYAIKDAYLWGCGSLDDEGPYVHLVKPRGELDWDPHWDAGPAACRADSALVLAVLDAPLDSTEGPLVALQNQLQELLRADHALAA